jgi:hypothetical protein
MLARWLLHIAPADSVDVHLLLLKIPYLPLDVAKGFTAAGARISYMQLLAAVNSQVQGVEAWVQAQQQPGILTDIPNTVFAVCCGVDWVSAACFLRLAETSYVLTCCCCHAVDGSWLFAAQHVRCD